MMMDNPANVVLVHVAGLRNVLLDELKENGLSFTLKKTIRGKRQDFLIGELSGEVDRLLKVKSCANAFVLVASFDDLPRGTRHALEKIEKAIGGADFESPLACLAAIRRESYKAPTSYMFTAITVDNELDTALLNRVARKSLPAVLGEHRQDAGYEVHVRLQCVGSNGFLGFQIPGETMKAREYKVITLPGSLDPVIAYSMIRISEPSDDDVFLDPLCGAGTCAIERCRYGAARRIIASDTSPDAIAATIANAASAGVSPEIHEWDAMALPLENASVTRVITDMPYGKDVSLSDAGSFIDGLFSEMGRILQPGGRFVLLTSSAAEVEDRVGRSAAFHKLKEYNVPLYGFGLKIYSLLRTQKPYAAKR